MTNDTRKVKYYWRSGQFEIGPPGRATVRLRSEDFDTEEEAQRDAEQNVKHRSKNWGYSWGGTSIYTIESKEISC
jgi:hypothetical protein